MHGSPRRSIGTALLSACLISALSASTAFARVPFEPATHPTGHFRTARVAVSLPTWQSNYAWGGGDGYGGWTSATGASDPGAYAFGAPLDGTSGLSLWLPGDRWYTNGAAEWHLEAPGTTRIASADLHLSYRDNLFAHHCLDLGLRDGAGTRDDVGSCSPPGIDGSYDVALSDPSAQPTAKQAFVRVEFPPCHNANGKGCPKWIPSLDPSQNAPRVRLNGIELTLVDDDLPTATASGPLFEAADDYIQGTDPVDVTVSAQDAGAGVARVWADSGGANLAEGEIACDPGHHDAGLGAAICPPSGAATLSVPTAGLPEGANTFAVGARDLAGNEGRSGAWTVKVDRTAPEQPSNITTDFDDEESTTFVEWQDGLDPDLPDGTPGSGVDHDLYRYALGAGEWSPWIPAGDHGFALPGVQPGTEITIEVKTVDAVGNESIATSDTLGVDGPVDDDGVDDLVEGDAGEYSEPGLVASAARVDDVDLAAKTPCRSFPSEYFFPKGYKGEPTARITRKATAPYVRVAKFDPFKPVLPKCRYGAHGTRDVGVFRTSDGNWHDFSLHAALTYLNTKAHDSRGVYVRDSLNNEIMRIKYLRGWDCAGHDKQTNHARYQVWIYPTPGDTSQSEYDCADISDVKHPTSVAKTAKFTLQGDACITKVHDRHAFAMIAIVLNTNSGKETSIRGFVPKDVLPSKTRNGALIPSDLPDTGCGGALDNEPPRTFDTGGLMKFYYRQDTHRTPVSPYNNYNAHDIGGRVDAGQAYEYVLINTSAVANGGIARAVVPAGQKFDARDNFNYCDPNGAGPYQVGRDGRTLLKASVKPRVSWTYGQVRSPSSGNPGARIYGWVPTSSLDGTSAPTDPDCRFDDTHWDFGASPASDYPYFFTTP